jgi:hypothetical protein
MKDVNDFYIIVKYAFTWFPAGFSFIISFM